MGARLNRGNFDNGMRKAAMRHGHRLGQEIVNEARQRCPVDEGRLRASIDYTITEKPSGVKVVVGSPLPYAKHFHTGTGIHGPHGTPIVPTRKRSASGGPPFLKFTPKGAGAPLFRRSVKGIEKNPFLADALVAVMGNIARRRDK